MSDTTSAFNTNNPATPPTLPSVNDLKSQASDAAAQARSSLNALADEARSKVNAMVDQQKSAGADHLSGIAHAVNAAAGDLEGQSPAVARLVRDAASSVDRFAGDLRQSDVRDVLASVTTMARQQPVAFFAGSVLIGFALARFLKSEGAGRPAAAVSRAPAQPATGGESGFRDWSATHAG